MKINKHYYSLHYSESDLILATEEIMNFLKERIDFSNPAMLIEKREDARLMLQHSSKAFLTVDYINKKISGRSSEEYAAYSSLRNYIEMLRKDLETVIFSIGNALNFLRAER